MSSSMLFGSLGDILTDDPHTPGLHIGTGYTYGDPQQVTTTVAALLTDGERVTAQRAGNRTFSFSVVVIGTDRADLTARVDETLAMVARGGYMLTWTPDGGHPIVWDCFVGQATVEWDVIVEEAAFGQQIDLTIPALPYGRSDTPSAVTVTEAVAGVRASLFALTGLLGSARAPVAAHATFDGAVSAWLMHLPPSDADPLAPIFTELPDWSAQTVTLPDAGLLRGTYTVLLGIGTYDAPGEDRTMQVQVTQAGAATTQTLERAYTSELNLRPLAVGQITLPLTDRPAGAAVELTFDFVDSGATQVISLMLLDTRGQTVRSLAQPSGIGGTVAAWIDEPAPAAAAGRVWGSPTSAKDAAYAPAELRMDGGGLSLSRDHEGARMLVHGAEFDPASLALSYAPRWLAERVE